MQFFSAGGRDFYIEKRLVRICGLAAAWYETVEDPEILVEYVKKSKQKAHLFTFFQRVPDIDPQYAYYMEPYSVAVIRLSRYEDWWNNDIGKKTRQMVKKAQKSGVDVRAVSFDDEFVRGISDIYNETPMRQGRKFPHYNDALEKVRAENSTFKERSIYVGAYYQNDLIGFARVVCEEKFADILQLLSKVSHREKCATNALLAKAVELCAERSTGYLVYGDWDMSGLGDFKRHNGFSKMDLPRYYIPLNWTGEIALKFGLHRRYSDLLPEKVVPFLKDIRRKWHEFAADGSR